MNKSENDKVNKLYNFGTILILFIAIISLFIIKIMKIPFPIISSIIVLTSTFACIMGLMIDKISWKREKEERI